MNILVFNGSPKGNDLSITNLHVEFLKQRFREHDFTTIPISRQIKKMERDDASFQSVVAKMKQAQLIIWAFPIYLYQIPGQLKRFIEMLYERLPKKALYNTYTTSISTSALIFDSPAHDYVHAVSEDFGMIYLPGFSFDSIINRELLQPEVQRGYIQGFENIIRMIEKGVLPAIRYQKLSWFEHDFTPSEPPETLPKKRDKKIIIVTDSAPGSNLDKMIKLFRARTAYGSEVINLNDINMKSGCTGCLQCQYQPRCVIKDDINELYINRILVADCVVLALKITDHHISARFKMFLDRGIFAVQKPKNSTRYITYIVSGPLRQRHIVREFLDIYASARFLGNLGYVSDEYTSDIYLTNLIDNQAQDVDYHLRQDIFRTSNFFARAYHMMMREMLTVQTSVKREAYLHYHKERLFDFPHLTPRHMLTGLANNIVFNLPIIGKHARRNVLQLYRSHFIKVLKS